MNAKEEKGMGITKDSSRKAVRRGTSTKGQSVSSASPASAAEAVSLDTLAAGALSAASPVSSVFGDSRVFGLLDGMKEKSSEIMAQPLSGAMKEAIEQAISSGNARVSVDCYMDSGMLTAEPEILAGVSATKVEKMAEVFDALKVNPVRVSARDGKFYVFDGIHTLEMLRKVYGRQDIPVECKVYFGLTREEEAAFYANQEEFTTRTPMPFKLRALKVAKDGTVLDFLSTTEEAGFVIELGTHSKRSGHIAATCAAYEAYILLNRKRYSEMLGIILQTWGGENWTVTKNMLKGMSVFMNMYGGEKGTDVDISRFISRLRKVTASDIRRRAETYRGMAVGSAFGIAIADYYEGMAFAA